MAQFSTSQSQLFCSLVRCVRRYASIPIPPFINPEQKAEQFALEHPQDAEKMINELYTLLHSYVTDQYK